MMSANIHNGHTRVFHHSLSDVLYYHCNGRMLVNDLKPSLAVILEFFTPWGCSTRLALLRFTDVIHGRDQDATENR